MLIYSQPDLRLATMAEAMDYSVATVMKLIADLDRVLSTLCVLGWIFKVHGRAVRTVWCGVFPCWVQERAVASGSEGYVIREGGEG
jgi:hypothetical protein